MNCQPDRPAPFRCPSREEVVAGLLALLPSGRAWQSNEGGPPPDTTLFRYWAAFGDVLKFANDRLCALRLEFFCATQSETHELWLQEYRLPDACDPFPDLCAKVAALGGTRCDYFTAVAARAGWSITCYDANDGCGLECGDDYAGDAVAGNGPPLAALVIVVDLAASPSYVASDEGGPYAGALETGLSLACDADFTALACILERIVHAEILIIYETTGE